MDDLRFLLTSNSIIKILKILKKAGKITLDWKISNTVIYNISKTKAI